MAIDVGGGTGISPIIVSQYKSSSTTSSEVDRMQAVGDGSRIRMPTSTVGTLALLNASSGTLWSLAVSDIEATADSWQGFIYLDSVNQKLFVMVYKVADISNYLASVDISSGAVTPLGSYVTSLGLSTFIAPTRATETSGDFTFVQSNEVIVVDSGNGSLVSSVPLVLDGVTTTYDNNVISGILSPNGKYLLGRVEAAFNEGGGVIANIHMVATNGGFHRVPLPYEQIRRSSGILLPKEWAGDNIMLSTHATTTVAVYGDTMFNKADFFRYIDEKLGL